jgi:cytochrome P450
VATRPRAEGPTALRLLIDQLPGRRLDRLAAGIAWRQAHGDVVSLPFRRPPTLQLNGPDDIRHVLVTNGANYRKTAWLVRGQAFLGDGLLSSSEPLHGAERSTLRPGFQRDHVQSFATIMAEEADACAAGWAPGAVIDVSHAMARLTLVTLGRTMLNADLRDEADRLIAAFLVCQKFMMRETAFLPDRFPTPLRLRYAAAIERIDRVVYGLIAARRASGADPGDVLSLLLAARTADNRPLDDRLIRDEIVTLLWAGHETTFNALEWAWYFLSENEPVRARLTAELDAVLAGRVPTLDDLPRLPYADRVFAETLRLYPPAWILARWALADDLLPSGRRVPRNTLLLILPYVVQRDPRFFPDPDRFDPDRFAPEHRAGRPAFAYFPFGAGTRVCIGEHYARLQGVLALATIARRCRLALAPGQRVRPLPMITVRPARPLMMVVHAHGGAGR